MAIILGFPNPRRPEVKKCHCSACQKLYHDCEAKGIIMEPFTFEMLEAVFKFALEGDKL